MRKLAITKGSDPDHFYSFQLGTDYYTNKFKQFRNDTRDYKQFARLFTLRESRGYRTSRVIEGSR